jgi:hypothetical protein
MKRLPELKIEFIDPIGVPKEEMERRWNELYDMIFKETIKMMERSTDPDDKAFLEKHPHWRESFNV